jgi:putative addiction module killer protein
MEITERDVVSYKTASRAFPFREWRDSFNDHVTRAAIDARVARLRGGNFGDSKAVGAGVLESRIDCGPGYRIYYGVDSSRVVLLCGGDKSTQDSDVLGARRYWNDYKKRERDRRAPSEKKARK